MKEIAHILEQWTLNRPSLTIGFAGVENQSSFDMLSMSESLKFLDKMVLSQLVITLNSFAKLNQDGRLHRPSRLGETKYIFLTWHSRIWLTKCIELRSPARGGSHLKYEMYDLDDKVNSITRALQSFPGSRILEKVASKFGLLNSDEVIDTYTDTNTSQCLLYTNDNLWAEELSILIDHMTQHIDAVQWYVIDTDIDTENKTNKQHSRHQLLDNSLQLNNDIIAHNPQAFEIFIDAVYGNTRFSQLNETEQISFVYWLLSLYVSTTSRDNVEYDMNHSLVSGFMVCWNNIDDYDLIDETFINKFLICLTGYIAKSPAMLIA